VDGVIWFFSIFLAVVFAVGLALTFVPVFAKWSAYRHSVLIRLDLPSRLQPAVSARLMASGRGAIVGGLVFSILGLVALSLDVSGGDTPRSASFLLLGAAIAGSTVGTTVAALTGSRTIPSDQPRVARSNVATVADYVFPLERIGARVLVVLAVAVTIAIAVVDAGGLVSAAVFFAVLAAITLVLFEIAGRRVVDRSQPAGSTGELVWDDAIRALILRDMLVAPLTLAAFSLFIGVAHLLGGNNGPDSLVSVFPTFVALAVTLYSRASRPQRYFLTRLWPNLRWRDTADTVTDAA
jgi:hypothetical protein